MEQVREKVFPDPLEKMGRCLVRRVTDHLLEFIPRLVVELHLSPEDPFKGSEEDGDLGKTRSVHHFVRIGIGHPRRGKVRDIHQGDGKALFGYGLLQAE